MIAIPRLQNYLFFKPKYTYSREFFRKLFQKPIEPKDELITAPDFHQFLLKVQKIEEQSGNSYDGKHHYRQLGLLLFKKYFKYFCYFLFRTAYLFLDEYKRFIVLFVILWY